MCADFSFQPTVPTTSHITLTGTNNIPELLASSVPSTLPGVVGSIPELVSGCLPHFVTSRMPELGASSSFSESGIHSTDISTECVSNLEGGPSAIFDGSAVPRDQQKTGKHLLAQLEKDLLEFDLLMGCPPSPPEVDTDSLEETLRSLSLLSSQEPLFRSVYPNRPRVEEDSDSDTVKSETSNFSCDSLEDRENGVEGPASEPEREATTPRHHNCEASKTLTFPRRKRQRWQRLSLEGVAKKKPNDYEADVFPTNEMPSSHSQIFRTASDTALANSDGNHSDVQTPTNPPYFSVKSPGHTTSSRCIVPPEPSHDPVNQSEEEPSQDNGSGNTVSTVTVETHSYRYERSTPLSFSIPQSPVIEQLRRQSRESSIWQQQPNKNRAILPPASIVDPRDFPVVQAQPLPPGPPPAVYLPSSQPPLSHGGISAPGRAHRILLAKKVTIQQVLPSKRKSWITCLSLA